MKNAIWLHSLIFLRFPDFQNEVSSPLLPTASKSLNYAGYNSGHSWASSTTSIAFQALHSIDEV
eukprot:CCRYP_015972-RA/>CCRYP_015972-RA protein AED:0.46 eAED:0.46 QI:0/-1/0/1/-1/1/1/0/63